MTERPRECCPPAGRRAQAFGGPCERPGRGGPPAAPATAGLLSPRKRSAPPDGGDHARAGAGGLPEHRASRVPLAMPGAMQ